MAINFDGPNKEILLSGTGDLSFEVIDIYSRWKDWVAAGNAQFLPAMRSVGGDPISPTQNLGSTFFLINGWRLRTKEADHALELVGNLYTDPAGDDVVKPTVGAYNVLVQYSVSNLVDAALVNAEELSYAGAVWLDENTANTGTNYPMGTSAFPVNNISDADAIAVQYGLTQYNFRGTFTTEMGYSHTRFVGIGPVNSSVIIVNSHTMHECIFERCSVAGSGLMDGAGCQMVEGIINAFTGWNGVVSDSGIVGTTTVSGQLLGRSVSAIGSNGVDPLDDPTIIDYGGANSVVKMVSHGGDWQFQNTGATSQVHITVSDYGLVRFMSSVNAATSISLTGLLRVDNQSSATPDVRSADNKVDEIHKLHGLDSGAPLIVTTTSRDAGAGISQTIADVAGTVTVTRT